MTTRGGPGGRIAPDGRSPRAKGVGRNAKRHDLEKPKARLHGMDLQQGDVAAMEQGQRIAPATTQGPATPQPPSGGGAPTRTPSVGAAPSSPLEIAKGRLGGTLNAAPGAPQKGYEKARQWGSFFGLMAQQPNVPTGTRLRARQQQENLRQTFRGPRHEVFNFHQADEFIDDFLTSEGF